MKVIVAGGRDFKNYYLLCKVLNNFHKENKITEVVCGGARGADSLGEQWAKEHNILVKYFPADWDVYGAAAGYIRNQAMAEYGDYLIVFWDGKAGGNKNIIYCIKQIKKHGKVINY